MRRRDFIKAIATSAVGWPLHARAQPAKMRRVSVLLGLAENDPEASARVKAFRLGMRDLEWIEGRNIQIDYRFAGSSLELINRHVSELIKSAPEVIVANSTPVMRALKPAITAIPIVFVVVNDPVGQGFISNLKQPGGNITGYSFIEPEIIGKWINLLADIKPALTRVTLMFNPNTAPYYDRFIQSYKASRGPSPVEVSGVHVQSVDGIERAVAELARDRSGGLIAPGDPYILTARAAILASARQHGLPIISPYRQFVAEGSLMSYGPDTADIFRRSSAYVDRVLKGEAIGRLPAQSPDRFELVINLKSAKALGLSVRQSFLLLADEVIE
ncbi:MAG TPA: ABC transporter substrate-binding protein [Pseudolabrys sp.]|jgi:putative ABC transport system substrate-binding protein